MLLATAAKALAKEVPVGHQQSKYIIKMKND